MQEDAEDYIERALPSELELEQREAKSVDGVAVSTWEPLFHLGWIHCESTLVRRW